MWRDNEKVKSTEKGMVEKLEIKEKDEGLEEGITGRSTEGSEWRVIFNTRQDRENSKC